MSYCVNCGVELAPKSPKCPLCGVVVINPVDNNIAGEALYPEHVVVKRECFQPNSSFLKIYTIVLLVPLLLTLSLDLLITHRVSWSFYPITSIMLVWILTVFPFVLKTRRAFKIISIDALSIALYLLGLNSITGKITWAWYVVASLALVWVFISFPLFLKKYPAFYFIIIDGIAIAAYLWFIETYTQSGAWFLYLALPIDILLTLLVLSVVFVGYLKKMNGYGMTGVVFTVVSFFCLGVDYILKNYLGGAIYSGGWSLVVVISCLPIAGLLFILERDTGLQTLLHKKFHL